MDSPHVLAIDDDPVMRELIADYLGENDLRVTAVATGDDMARVLSEHAIDVIVLDLGLAGEDGMELARKVRAGSTIPIIMVTGRKEEADRVMGLELAPQALEGLPALGFNALRAVEQRVR